MVVITSDKIVVYNYFNKMIITLSKSITNHFLVSMVVLEILLNNKL